MNDCHKETETRLAAHLRFVGTHSPYYRELWKDAWSETDIPLTALPLTDLASYWAANTPLDSRVLTSPQVDGPVYKSGGTTGNPKFSFFSNEDWRSLCDVFGAGMRRGGLRAGERIANLFYGGQLYASFLFLGRAIEQAGVGIHFPLSGSAPAAEVVKTLQQFRIDTLASVPTSVLALLPELESVDPDTLCVKRFLYGGESVFPDQVAALQRVLPGCVVQSVGIAGVDYGEMGWSEPGTEPGVHRCFDESTVLEILDDHGRPIDELQTPGDLVITNFRRRLMPVIRYPVGDRGIWLDPPGTPSRRFRVLGRSNNCARIGPVSLYAEDVHDVLARVAGHQVINFQIVVEHVDRRDRCTVRAAVSHPEAVSGELSHAVLETLMRERPMISDLVARGIIHPVVIEWVSPRDLVTNARTGKTMRVADRRME